MVPRTTKRPFADSRHPPGGGRVVRCVSSTLSRWPSRSPGSPTSSASQTGFRRSRRTSPGLPPSALPGGGVQRCGSKELTVPAPSCTAEGPQAASGFVLNWSHKAKGVGAPTPHCRRECTEPDCELGGWSLPCWHRVVDVGGGRESSRLAGVHFQGKAEQQKRQPQVGQVSALRTLQSRCGQWGNTTGKRRAGQGLRGQGQFQVRNFPNGPPWNAPGSE